MKILVFGGNGSIGKEIAKQLSSEHDVFIASHKDSKDSLAKFETDSFAGVLENGPYDGVVWATGKNINDNIGELSYHQYQDILEANLNFIVKTLSSLIQSKSINNGASLVLISSIWQDFARNNKFSYSVSKSALSGMIKSLSVDLGPRGIRVNSVSPGVVLNEMSKKNLNNDQIMKIQLETPLRQLVTEADVANAVAWLISPLSKSITGQNLIVDGGWTISRYV
jgi:NAD(P)-dependent dehydrogenase (short-subunit alcohol dehydrogenase family)